MTRPVVRVGIIGGGLMGREAAAALSRWCALEDVPVTAVLTAVCDINPGALAWFDRIGTIELSTQDYRELLDSRDVDVLYVAVRHDLHEELYLDAIEAGKDLLAEKPFGIDAASASRVVTAAAARPELFVRCSSEIPFFPGAQAAFSLARSGRLGRIVEVRHWFSHSSDLDLEKPISWKRQTQYCGKGGVLHDLGVHVLHLPLRLGWQPREVYAILQDLVLDRPDGHGARVRCDAIENATLLCKAGGPREEFPLTLETKRIDPGQMNTWGIRIVGMDGSVLWTTKRAKVLRLLDSADPGQAWRHVDTGSQSVFRTVTGGIFEFGFSDAILQMWAAFLTERAGALGGRFGCLTPEEALASHRVIAAALESAGKRAVVVQGAATPIAPMEETTS